MNLRIVVLLVIFSGCDVRLENVKTIPGINLLVSLFLYFRRCRRKSKRRTWYGKIVQRICGGGTRSWRHCVGVQVFTTWLTSWTCQGTNYWVSSSWRRGFELLLLVDYFQLWKIRWKFMKAWVPSLLRTRLCFILKCCSVLLFKIAIAFWASGAV